MEEQLASETVFTGRILKVRVDTVVLTPEGHRARREVVEHPGAVAMVPLTADGDVLLVRQYRYAAGTDLLEIPAGTLNPGEHPLDCARRELSEETGGQAASFELLASVFTSPGFCDERIHIYLARLVGEPLGQPHPEFDERLHVETLPFAEAVERALSGQIRDAKSVVGLLLAAARLGSRPG